MLKNTFQHLDGWGTLKEREMWNSKIFTWDDYFMKMGGNQLNLFVGSPKDLLEESRIKLDKRDGKYFAEKLPASAYYRIAHSMPEKTIFVDIETTGLSRYYNKITIIGWSIMDKYSVCLPGDKNGEMKLFDDFSNAECIITFNGSLFDIPFIKSTYPSLKIPKCHIDLRFFCRRVGLSGGQKVVEKQLGFKRPESLIDVDGFEATILWHHYKNGEKDSLKTLIEYNAQDIYGMKYVFEKATDLLISSEDESISKSSIVNFSDHKALPEFIDRNSVNFIALPVYTGKTDPKVKLHDLPAIGSKVIVGIDLTGSEQKATGWALLENGIAITRRILSDQEIINETIKANPTIISIDSPLSLPVGRVSVFDDDPGRKEFGITRYCERLMSKRGVKSYPCLIQSMQRLTLRGIKLANQFRRLGYAVIESYPGAAQDILGIPRKKKSIEYLVKGLEAFGIKGDYLSNEVSHDELDAITSAIVGYFYLVNQYEALGNEDEDYLIVPRIDSNLNKERVVIGVSGKIAAGKTTFSKILEDLGFAYGRYSMVIDKLLVSQGLEPNRSNQQIVGEKVHKEMGQRWLGKELISSLPSDRNLVIDGLRFPEDHAFLRERFGNSFHHVHLEADDRTRRERYGLTVRNDRPFEHADAFFTENSTEALKSLADGVVLNVGSIRDLTEQAEILIASLCQYQS